MIEYSPQEAMKMVLNEKTQKMQYDYVYPSKTLDHYEKYGIYEVHRSPMHLHGDALIYDMLSNQQLKHLVDQGIELMRVNVGAYISILCHIESIDAQSH
jgi:1,4-alpha-glucan branching enzyme